MNLVPGVFRAPLNILVLLRCLLAGTILGQTLPAPVLVTPPNNAVDVSPRPVFEWTKVSGASSYDLEILIGNDLYTNATRLTTNRFNDVVLPEEQTCSWRVSSGSAKYPGQWSEYWTFRTKPPIPPPVLWAPEDGATYTGFDVTLKWFEVTGATQYAWEVHAGNLLVLSNTTAATQVAIALPSHGTYQWQVRAFASLRPGPWSELRDFDTANLGSSAPISPGLNESDVPLIATLTWGKTSLATDYEYEIYLGPNRIEKNRSNGALTAVVPLWQHGRFEWRIRGLSATRIGPWSELRPFTTRTAAAWGTNTDGALAVPGGLGKVKAIAAGPGDSMMLLEDGSVHNWGVVDHWYWLSDVNPASSLRNIAFIGDSLWCSLALSREGVLYCWTRISDFDAYAEAQREKAAFTSNVPHDLINLQSLSVGLDHCLALRSNGEVVSWGANDDGQTQVPPGLSNVVSVAAGWSYSLALKSDGTVIAWGFNGLGQCSMPPGLSNVVAIAAGAKGTALKSDGTVVEWGEPKLSLPYYWEERPSDLNQVAAISASSTACFAIRGDGTVVAWGVRPDTTGQLDIPRRLKGVTAIAPGVTTHTIVLLGEGAPTITVPPQNLIAFQGTTVTFFVGAVGTQPMRYQWQYNGHDLQGATNSSLSLPYVQPENAGRFQAVIANAEGVITSPEATLEIDVTPPSILVQPISQQILLTSNATFSVVASSRPPVNYQWYKDGSWLPGATNANYTINDMQPEEVGTYTVEVSNPMGSVMSAKADLSLRYEIPVITRQPLGDSVIAGVEVTFSVDATGSPPLTYQWLKDGINIPQATNATYSIAPVSTNDTGAYSVMVTNGGGSVTSDPALLTVLGTPANDAFAARIALSGLDTEVAGYNYFAGLESGEPKHANRNGGASVWWTWTAPANGVVTIDTMGSSFDTLLAVYRGDRLADLESQADDDDSGGNGTSQLHFTASFGVSYQIAVDGYGGQTGNIVLHLHQVPGAPAITSATMPNHGVAGQNAIFTLTAIGALPMHYQWQHNGTNIQGANDTRLTLSPVTASSSGTYSVLVNNSLGSASLSAIFNVEVRLAAEKPTHQIRLHWAGDFFLQSSTNVIGPYADMPEAVSPYTESLTPEPSRYFRLRPVK
jgi:alpha-tubulin suppressor-like RCC1 family protein